MHALLDRGQVPADLLRLWTARFTIGLRLPSEGLRLVRDPAPEPTAIALRKGGASVVLFFPRRNNQKYASISERKCWCDRPPSDVRAPRDLAHV